MLVEAFAKINWSLDITGVREDGYHLMDMLMQPVSLADDLTMTPARELSLTASGFPPVRADRSNLIWRAADALKQAAGYPGGAAIHVFLVFFIAYGDISDGILRVKRRFYIHRALLALSGSAEHLRVFRLFRQYGRFGNGDLAALGKLIRQIQRVDHGS